ncbi:UNVERIFIED_CONTAM: hypothetical protein FKN15_030222 [Acipenser sinensis]
MSVDALKKRKPKVIRNEGGTPEGKRMRGEGDQEARVYSEEVELEMRNPAQDYTLYKQTCEMLTRLMAEIHELKSSSSKDSAAEMEERRMQSCIHFMTLKKLNRVAHMRLKKGRDQTHEAKQRVDALHLQLQNLLYEVMHLQKEINKCLEFKSKHEEIELVSVEEFRRDAPQEISRPEISGADPHQLTLCRLDWELEQRKRLAEKYKESLASKEKIMKGIEIKKEYLSSLQPRLTEIMQASRPVQDYLSVPFEQTQKQNEVARHLPPPLYVLLVQANAYGQACDKKLSVSIIGDVNEAKALSKPPEDSQDDESDSDAEEEQNTQPKINRKKTFSSLILPLSRAERGGSHGPCLMCSQCGVSQCRVGGMCSQCGVSQCRVGGMCSQELLSPESLLNCLYPGDQGTETPNPANRYQFDKVGILMFGDYVAELGHPYTWVQNLGGLRFPTGRPEQAGPTGSSLSASHMEATMKLLKSRLESRLALHKQFASLGKELPYTQQVLEAGLVQETDLLFTALIERGTAKLQAAVVLNPRYSTVPPLFSLSLSWKGERSGRTDDNLRAMEAEVNVFHRELHGPRPGYQLLTNQLQRLCMCLDVFLETESQDESVEGPREFPREKMCLRTVREY